MKTFTKALLWLTGGLLVAAAVLVAWVLLTWDRVYDEVADQLTAPTATSETFKRWCAPTPVRRSR